MRWLAELMAPADAEAESAPPVFIGQEGTSALPCQNGNANHEKIGRFSTQRASTGWASSGFQIGFLELLGFLLNGTFGKVKLLK
jgi:hypothetical protein